MGSLKQHRLEKGGRSVSDKDKVKLSRSRDSQQDLRSVLSNKERKDREESRERRPRARDRIRHSSGDLRDRLDKYRDSDYRANLNCGDLSQGKNNLLSMFLEDNPCKDFKGKENGDLVDAIEITRKKKMELEKKLSSEWSERKKKKKRRSKSKSKARERKPLTSKETENKKRKLSPGYLKEEKDSYDEGKAKKGKRSTSREGRDG